MKTENFFWKYVNEMDRETKKQLGNSVYSFSQMEIKNEQQGQVGSLVDIKDYYLSYEDHLDKVLKKQSMKYFHLNIKEEDMREFFEILNSFDMEYYYLVRKKRFQDPIAPSNPYQIPLISDTDFQDVRFSYQFEKSKTLVIRFVSYIERKIGETPFSLDSDSSFNQIQILALIEPQ